MEIIDYKGFEKWLDLYKKAWEERNPDYVDDLFAESVIYSESPYSTNFEGIEGVKRYWKQGAQDSQLNIEFDYEIITVKSNVGYAKWRADFDRVGSKIHVELDGILEITFDENQKAVEFNEWWHRKEIKPNI